MLSNLLFIQPFAFRGNAFVNELLPWPIYLKSFLKDKLPQLNFELLYLPIEMKKIQFTFSSSDDTDKLFSLLDKLIAGLEFDLDGNTFICISATTSNHYLSTKIITEYFQKNFPSAIIGVGGTHATTCPQDFNHGNSSIDYIFLGEGEISLYNILTNTTRKNAIPKIIKGESIPNLDELPLLDFTIFDKYIEHFDLIPIQLSRGCPFHCHFCIEKKLLLLNKKVRGWRAYSPKRAIQEIKNIKEYGLSHDINDFGFTDPIFGLNKKWLEKFLDLYDFEDIKSAWTETRLDVLDRKLLERLQHKNIFLMYGVESYSKEMLSIMNKTSNPSAFLKKFDDLIQIHLELEHLCSLFIFCGHPGETTGSHEETFNQLEKILRNDPSNSIYLVIRQYHHFPGTHVYNRLDQFTKLYGTRAYYPNWWKDEEILTWGAYCISPSHDLNVKESYLLYSRDNIKILKEKSEILKKNRARNIIPQILTIKNEIKRLEKREQEFLQFLDEKNIP